MANENIISGLQAEKAGYEAKIEVLKVAKDSDGVEKYTGRIKQVDAALKDLGFDVKAKGAKETTAAAGAPENTAA